MVAQEAGTHAQQPPPPHIHKVLLSPPSTEDYHGGDYRRPPAAMVMRRVASMTGASPRHRSRSPGTFGDQGRRNSNNIHNHNTSITALNNTNKNNSNSAHVPIGNKSDFVSIGVENHSDGDVALNVMTSTSHNNRHVAMKASGAPDENMSPGSGVLASGSIHVAVTNILTSASSANAAPSTRKLRRSMKKRSITSSCAFIVCSTTMVMCNKGLASVFPESSSFPTLLVAWQCVVSVLLCFAGSRLGYFSFSELSAETAMRYLPVSCIFVAMVFSSFMALAHLTVPTVTVVKNLTNIIIVLGDWYAFGNQPTPMVYLSFGFMVVGAAAPVFNDLSFSVVGYGWMAVNCFSTAAYVLALRWLSVKTLPPARVNTMVRKDSGTSSDIAPGSGGRPVHSMLKTRNSASQGQAASGGSGGEAGGVAKDLTNKSNRFEVVLYNNSLAAPMLLGLAVSMGEIGNFVAAQDTVDSFNFGVLAVMSGAAGFFLNVASLWCLGSVSATTYAIVGSLNKVPIIILGHIIYGDLVTTEGAGFVALAVAGALLYSLAKLERKSD